MGLMTIQVVSRSSAWKCEADKLCDYRATKQVVSEDGVRQIVCNTHSPQCDHSVIIGASTISCKRGMHINDVHRHTMVLNDDRMVTIEWRKRPVVTEDDEDMEEEEDDRA